ncbi:MAG: ABC transporter substrate-binding protein [Protaetiibacter sp.]
MISTSRRAGIALIAAATAVVLGLSGCTGTTPDDTGAGSDSPVRGGSMVVSCTETGTTTLDPAKGDNGVCQRTAFRALYSTLVAVDATGGINPEVATEWTVADDGLSIEFQLRDDVVFHDGSAVTADDVVYSFERMGADDTIGVGAVQVRDAIASATAVSATAVRFDLTAPNASLLVALGQAGVLPIVNQEVVEANDGDVSAADAGSGPFVLDEYTPGGEVSFLRFDQYFQEGEDGESLPYLDGFELVGLTDQAVRFLNLQSGDIDFAAQIATTDVKIAEASDDGIQILSFNDRVPTLSINTLVAPFDDKAVRQALVKGIDREAMINTLALGTGDVRPHWWIRGSWVDITSPDYVYDPEAAKSELAAAGYPDGFETTITIIARPADLQTAQILQTQLAEIGVTLNINVLDRATWIATTVAGHSEPLVLSNNYTYIDPNRVITTDWGSTGSGALNYPNWNDADSAYVQELGAEARETYDETERRAIYEEIVAAMIDASVSIPLGNWPSPDAVQPWIGGVTQTGLGEPRLEAAWSSKAN